MGGFHEGEGHFAGRAGTYAKHLLENASAGVPSSMHPGNFERLAARNPTRRRLGVSSALDGRLGGATWRQCLYRDQRPGRPSSPPPPAPAGIEKRNCRPNATPCLDSWPAPASRVRWKASVRRQAAGDSTGKSATAIEGGRHANKLKIGGSVSHHPPGASAFPGRARSRGLLPPSPPLDRCAARLAHDSPRDAQTFNRTAAAPSSRGVAARSAPRDRVPLAATRRTRGGR